MTRSKSACRMCSVISAEMRRSASVCRTRSRASSAIAPARANRSATPGLTTDGAAGRTDITGDGIPKFGSATNRGSRPAAVCATHGGQEQRAPAWTDASREEEGVTAESAALAVPAAKIERTAQLRTVAGWLWSGTLMVVLAFLVLYPVAMLLLGALTNTNPVVDGFGVFDLSLGNFIAVLGNPNVHFALANSLIACAGGTALA